MTIHTLYYSSSQAILIMTERIVECGRWKIRALKGLSYCHDLSGRSPHVVPVSIHLSKSEKDGVSSLKTHLYNVYATFIPTSVRSELDERGAHVAGSGVLTPSSQRPCGLLHVCHTSDRRMGNILLWDTKKGVVCRIFWCHFTFTVNQLVVIGDTIFVTKPLFCSFIIITPYLIHLWNINEKNVPIWCNRLLTYLKDIFTDIKT